MRYHFVACTLASVALCLVSAARSQEPNSQSSRQNADAVRPWRMNCDPPRDSARQDDATPRWQYLGMPVPGDRPERFAPDVIPTPPGVHSAPVFSKDGTLVLWSPMARGPETKIMRCINHVWSKPETIDFGMGEGVGEPFFSPDGRRLYFNSFCATPRDPVKRERIWYVERQGEAWSAPLVVDETVTSRPTHWQFSVAANYNLYFTSEADGVRGEQDIYMAKYENGRYLAPRDLGPNVNSDGMDCAPFIAPDESYLLFTRRDAGTRKADLHVSFRTADDEWTAAVSLGDLVNTDGNDLCPVVSPDGKYLFYTRTTPNGYGVFWLNASFLESLRPKSQP